MSRPFLAALALPQTFAATYSLLCLHVFMLLVRLRAEGNDGADLAQILYEGFQDDVELRVHAEGVKVGALHAVTICRTFVDGRPLAEDQWSAAAQWPCDVDVFQVCRKLQ